jgi:hypothetical protein
LFPFYSCVLFIDFLSGVPREYIAAINPKHRTIE